MNHDDVIATLDTVADVRVHEEKLVIFMSDDIHVRAWRRAARTRRVRRSGREGRKLLPLPGVLIVELRRAACEQASNDHHVQNAHRATLPTSPRKHKRN